MSVYDRDYFRRDHPEAKPTRRPSPPSPDDFDAEGLLAVYWDAIKAGSPPVEAMVALMRAFLLAMKMSPEQASRIAEKNVRDLTSGVIRPGTGFGAGFAVGLAQGAMVALKVKQIEKLMESAGGKG